MVISPRIIAGTHSIIETKKEAEVIYRAEKEHEGRTTENKLDISMTNLLQEHLAEARRPRDFNLLLHTRLVAAFAMEYLFWTLVFTVANPRFWWRPSDRTVLSLGAPLVLVLLWGNVQLPGVGPIPPYLRKICIDLVLLFGRVLNLVALGLEAVVSTVLWLVSDPAVPASDPCGSLLGLFCILGIWHVVWGFFEEIMLKLVSTVHRSKTGPVSYFLTNTVRYPRPLPDEFEVIIDLTDGNTNNDYRSRANAEKSDMNPEKALLIRESNLSSQLINYQEDLDSPEADDYVLCYHHTSLSMARLIMANHFRGTPWWGLSEFGFYYVLRTGRRDGSYFDLCFEYWRVAPRTAFKCDEEEIMTLVCLVPRRATLFGYRTNFGQAQSWAGSVKILGIVALKSKSGSAYDGSNPNIKSDLDSNLNSHTIITPDRMRFCPTTKEGPTRMRVLSLNVRSHVGPEWTTNGVCAFFRSGAWQGLLCKLSWFNATPPFWSRCHTLMRKHFLDDLPDLLCTQEDSPYVPALPGYRRLMFTNPSRWEGKGMAIYIREESSWVGRVRPGRVVSTGHILGGITGRDALTVEVELPKSSQVVEVANVHLTGGRYDDEHVAANSRLTGKAASVLGVDAAGLKRRELRRVLGLDEESQSEELKLDASKKDTVVELVLGDFNFGRRQTADSKYHEQVLKLRSQESRANFERAMQAPFRYLEEMGFLTEDLSATTPFGSQVDYAFVRGNGKRPGELSQSKMSVFKALEVTDHNGVCVDWYPGSLTSQTVPITRQRADSSFSTQGSESESAIAPRANRKMADGAHSMKPPSPGPGSHADHSCNLSSTRGAAMKGSESESGRSRCWRAASFAFGAAYAWISLQGALFLKERLLVHAPWEGIRGSTQSGYEKDISASSLVSAANWGLALLYVTEMIVVAAAGGRSLTDVHAKKVYIHHCGGVLMMGMCEVEAALRGVSGGSARLVGWVAPVILFCQFGEAYFCLTCALGVKRTAPAQRMRRVVAVTSMVLIMLAEWELCLQALTGLFGAEIFDGGNLHSCDNTNRPCLGILSTLFAICNVSGLVPGQNRLEKIKLQLGIKPPPAPNRSVGSLTWLGLVTFGMFLCVKFQKESGSHMGNCTAL